MHYLGQTARETWNSVLFYWVCPGWWLCLWHVECCSICLPGLVVVCVCISHRCVLFGAETVWALHKESHIQGAAKWYGGCKPHSWSVRYLVWIRSFILKVSHWRSFERFISNFLTCSVHQLCSWSRMGISWPLLRPLILYYLVVGHCTCNLCIVFHLYCSAEKCFEKSLSS